MYTLKQMHRKEAAQNIDHFIIETLVSKIRAYRIFYNISQRELSRKSGVTQNIISRMESGIAVPQLQTLIKLLDALELDLEINVKPRVKEEDFLESINQDKLNDMRQETQEVIKNHFQDTLIEEVNNMSELIKPGTDNKPPGKYKEVGPRGGQVSNPRKVKIDKGDRLPPTQEPGRKWIKTK